MKFKLLSPNLYEEVIVYFKNMENELETIVLTLEIPYFKTYLEYICRVVLHSGGLMMCPLDILKIAVF